MQERSRNGRARVAAKRRPNPAPWWMWAVLAGGLLATAPAWAQAPTVPEQVQPRAIPPGATVSYGQLAARLGRPTAARAVARAVGTNQIAIVIPCHRVLGADGSLTGYAGGLWDRLLMRVTDVFLAFPRLILALAFVAAMGPGVESAVIAIALTAWPPYARLARAETLGLVRADFIAAARLTGASPFRIVLRHVAPLCVPSLVVRVTLDMSSIILTAAGLGFLGMGAQPPSPEWGAMIATARRFILEQWWVPTAPGIAIFVASLAFNLLGDGLRDVLDPKQDG